jgi:hypothetical protein
MPWRYGFEDVGIASAVRRAAFGLAGGSFRCGAVMRLQLISSLNNLAEIIIIRTKFAVQRCSAELVVSDWERPSVVIGGADSQA